MKKLDQTAAMPGLVFLDGLFHALHVSIIFFFLFGWIMPETRIAHYILTLLILFSWCGLGMLFGFGYCLITDIQWRIKQHLGQKLTTEYYVKYIIDNVTGLNLRADIVNRITTYTFFGIFSVSSVLQLKTYVSFF